MIRGVISSVLSRVAHALDYLAAEISVPADPRDSEAKVPVGREDASGSTWEDIIPPPLMDKVRRSMEQEFASLLGEGGYDEVAEQVRKAGKDAKHNFISPMIPRFGRVEVPGDPSKVSVIHGPPRYKHGDGMFVGCYRGYDLYVFVPRMNCGDNPVERWEIKLTAKYGHRASISAFANKLLLEEQRMTHNDPLFEAYDLGVRFGLIRSCSV